VLYPGVTPADAERIVIPHPAGASAAAESVMADGGSDIRT
jgi:(2Fe-2S) ferredoxin